MAPADRAHGACWTPAEPSDGFAARPECADSRRAEFVAVSHRISNDADGISDFGITLGAKVIQWGQHKFTDRFDLTPY